MGKLLKVTAHSGRRIAIVASYVTGVIERNAVERCFIATGKCKEGDEDGWYVMEDFDTVKEQLEHCLEGE